MLNKSGGILSLVLFYLRGKAFNLLLLTMMTAVGLLDMAFIKLLHSFFLMFIWQGGGGEWAEERHRMRERESQAGSVLSAEPDAGLYLTNCDIMTWGEIKGWMLNWLSHPNAPSYTPSIPNWLREFFIMNGNCILPFFLSIAIITWFLSLILLMWCSIFFGSYILNHSCIAGINPPW